MPSFYDRIVLTVIALALAAIALNPWLAPGPTQAQSRVMDVNIAQINGASLNRWGYSLPVMVVQGADREGR